MTKFCVATWIWLNIGEEITEICIFMKLLDFITKKTMNCFYKKADFCGLYSFF